MYLKYFEANIKNINDTINSYIVHNSYMDKIIN